METISKETILRLPGYLKLLKKLNRQGVENVSSTAIAERLYLNPVQVRKDISAVSSSAGKPKTGFVTKELIKDISDYLGYNRDTEAVIVGVGQLGGALLGYTNFNSYGLDIIAGFDNNLTRNAEINGKPIFPVNQLTGLVQRLGVKIGIIAVPKASAQSVCDMMVNSGIRAIWNFAPTHLDVPSNVVLKNEDMAASLALLSLKLHQTIEDENK